MKFMYLFLIVALFSKCNHSAQPKDFQIDRAQKIASSDIDLSVKNLLHHQLENDINYPTSAGAYYQGKHKDEILRTLEIVEKIEVPSLKSTLVFYRYSIGSDVLRKTSWYKQLDGKWYAHHAFYSDYANDPFNDGNPDEAKKILKKIEQWVDAQNSVWWD